MYADEDELEREDLEKSESVGEVMKEAEEEVEAMEAFRGVGGRG